MTGGECKQILTWGPDRGNPSLTRQGRGAGAPAGRITGPHRGTRAPPARVRLEEAIGVNRYRTKVKRRKAYVEGELPASGDALYLLVSRGYWRRDRFKV